MIPTPPIPVTPPHVSVNRVRIEDLPGLPLDEEVRGQQASNLLSTAAVIRTARARAASLRLPPAYAEDSPRTRQELAAWVDACLDSPHAEVRRAAEEIAQRLGRNLGFVLLTLHRGDKVNRAARADWGPHDWARWAAVQQVWLGGGLMSGKLGKRVVEHSQALLAESGYAGQPRLGVSPHAREMALLGAARYLPAETDRAIALDFGQTSVKRAALAFRRGSLVGARLYAPLPVAGTWITAPEATQTTSAQEVLAFVLDALVKTCREGEAEGQLRPGGAVGSSALEVMLCIAAYVREGRLHGNGPYALLNTLATDVRELVAEAAASRIGRTCRVHLIHDGTAAAALHAGERNTAVIVAGTALGVGFPPADAAGLRPIRLGREAMTS